MIRTWKPFQPKIQLHIKTEFLQNLWNKYVPVSSEQYGRISLIYLNRGYDTQKEPESRVQLFIRLILKNVLVQMNLSRNSMVMNRDTVIRRFAETTNFYLTQLRAMDFHAYQSLSRYMALLEQNIQEDRRYQRWSREHQKILELQRDYERLDVFSKTLKEWLEGPAWELEAALGQELFSSLGKRDYELLSEALIWTEKHRTEDYIRRCSPEKYREILKRLEQETKLYEVFWGHRSRKTGKEEFSAVPEGGKEEFSAVPEAEKEKFPAVPEAGKVEGGHVFKAQSFYQLEKEEFIFLAEKLGPKEFRDLYQKVLFLESSAASESFRASFSAAGLIWKRKKREVKRQLRELKAEAVSVFLEKFPLLLAETCRMQKALEEEAGTGEAVEQSRLRAEICRKYEKRIKKIQEKYAVQLRRSWEQTIPQAETVRVYAELSETKNFREVMETAETVFSTEQVLPAKQEEEIRKGRQALEAEQAKELTWNKTWRLFREIRERLQNRKQEMIGLERKALEGYEKLLPVWEQRKTAEAFTDFTILDRTFVRKMRYWAMALLETPEEDAHLTTLQEESKPEEAAELQQFLTRVSGFQKPGETFVYRESPLRDPAIHELLLHVRKLEEGKEREFAKQMADMLTICRLSVPGSVHLPKQEGIRPSESETVRSLEWEVIRQSASESSRPPEPEFFQKPEEEPLGELEVWGRALLVPFLEKGKEDEAFTEQSLSGPFLPRKNESGDTSSEKLSPEQIRQRMEVSRKQAGLQKLLDQVNHQIWGTEVTLVYRESQLQDVSIQALLERLAGLKEKEYQELVRGLSEAVVRQIEREQSRSIWREQKPEEEPFDELEVWGRALLVPFLEKGKGEEAFMEQSLSDPFLPENDELRDTSSEKLSPEQIRQRIEISRKQAGLQKLLDQVNHQIRGTEVTLVYRESQLQDASIQALLEKLAGAKEKEYQELVRGLSEAVERQLGQGQSHSIWREQKPEEEPLGELDVWGRALLVPLQIRQRMEVSRKQAGLQKLLDQVNHQIQGTKVTLVYRESQLQDASIQALLEKLAGAKEKEYQELVRGLSKAVERQLEQGQSRFIQREQKSKQTDSKEDEREFFRLAKEQRIFETYPVLVHRILEYEKKRKESVSGIFPMAGAEGKQLESEIRRSLLWMETGREKSQEQMFYRKQISSDTQGFLSSGPLGDVPGGFRDPLSDDATRFLQANPENLQSGIEHTFLKAFSEAGNDTGRQNLRHSLEYAHLEQSKEEGGQKEQARRRAEEAREKAFQQQLEVRLKEVERRLQETESRSPDRENIRDITEKVKRQLHEELHLERLRRGLL